MFNLDSWLDEYTAAVDAAFGSRIVFIGLQGSYARGEAHEGSDIDVVLLLDNLTPGDLKAYRTAVAALPHRDKLCGFISGEAELKAWDRADLFQFYHDTKAIYGDLKFIEPLLSAAAVRRAVHMAACNIYHACAHNFLHERSAEILKSLYKAAVFALQAKVYLQTGLYVSSRRNLPERLSGADYEVFAAAAALQQDNAAEEAVEKYSGLLLSWSSGIIKAGGSVSDE